MVHVILNLVFVQHEHYEMEITIRVVIQAHGRVLGSEYEQLVPHVR